MSDSDSQQRFKLDTLWLLIGVGVLIRLVFLGILNLLPEEAYYWSYAQHLDIGYLDHPPMVAWLNYIFGTVLGRSEFVVRLPAFLGWFLMAYFMYRLTENTVGKEAGKPVVLLLAALPIYMSIGFLMTPDAPFYVCWAGALYYLERAILGNRQSAWLGAGICLGLGLLSKYTMALVVPATLVFLLLDKNSRRWLLKPQPYLAMLLGLVLFLPVIYWNDQHGWASFAFQGTRRWSGGIDFQLHILIASILVLITPLGFYEAVKVYVRVWRHRNEMRSTENLTFRKYLFLATFAAVPLAVFIIHSSQGQPKLNWTGPVWLTLLPLIAASISGFRFGRETDHAPRLSRTWLATTLTLLLFYLAGFSYLILGMPGTEVKEGMKFPIAWRAYGERVESIEQRIESEAHTEPLIIGLDKYWLAAEASFYDEPDNDSLPEFAGLKLVGGSSLMWDIWVPPQSAEGRDALLVSFTADKLKDSSVTRHFLQMGDVKKEVFTRGDREIGFVYWRVGYDYQP